MARERSSFIYKSGVEIPVGEEGDEPTAFDKGEPVFDTPTRDSYIVESGSSVLDFDEALVRLGKLTADEKLLEAGASTTLSITVLNETESSLDYTLEFKEDSDPGPGTANYTVIDTQTKTIQPAETVEFTTTVQKDTTGTRRYKANNSAPLDVTWMNFDVGGFVADPNPADLSAGEETVTISIDALNTSSSSREIEIRFYESRFGSRIGSGTSTISPGSKETFSATFTRTSPTERFFFVEAEETATGLTGTSPELRVNWVADLSDQQVDFNVNTGSVQYFGGGKEFPPGEYRLEVSDGRYTFWGDEVPDRYECDGVLDEDEKTWVYAPCNLIEGGDPLGPDVIYDGNNVQQTTVFTNKDLGDTTGSGDGIITLENSSTVGIEMVDVGGFDDNQGGGFTYTLFQID